MSLRFITHGTVWQVLSILQKKNPDKEKIMKIWKDYYNWQSLKVSSVIIEKAMKTIKSKTVNSYWRKLSLDIMPNFKKGFRTERIKETTKEMVDGQKDVDLRGIKVQINTTPEEFTHDNWMRMSASEPVLRFR